LGVFDRLANVSQLDQPVAGLLCVHLGIASSNCSQALIAQLDVLFDKFPLTRSPINLAHGQIVIATRPPKQVLLLTSLSACMNAWMNVAASAGTIPLP
jgi:hypothetical protein